MTATNSFSEPISVAKLRRDLADVLNRAHYNNTTTPVENHGKPFAAVISNEDARLLAFVKDAASAPNGSPLRCAAKRLIRFFRNSMRPRRQPGLHKPIHHAAHRLSVNGLEELHGPKKFASGSHLQSRCRRLSG
jgi:hypothetical protein